MPWQGGHYFPNKRSTYGPVTEIPATIHDCRFFHGQVIKNLPTQTIHNWLDITVTTSDIYLNKFISFSYNSIVGLLMCLI